MTPLAEKILRKEAEKCLTSSVIARMKHLIILARSRCLNFPPSKALGAIKINEILFQTHSIGTRASVAMHQHMFQPPYA